MYNVDGVYCKIATVERYALQTRYPLFSTVITSGQNVNCIHDKNKSMALREEL
jgi:hypothetical protein